MISWKWFFICHYWLNTANPCVVPYYPRVFDMLREQWDQVDSDCGISTSLVPRLSPRTMTMLSCRGRAWEWGYISIHLLIPIHTLVIITFCGDNFNVARLFLTMQKVLWGGDCPSSAFSPSLQGWAIRGQAGGRDLLPGPRRVSKAGLHFSVGQWANRIQSECTTEIHTWGKRNC